jgi:hypothetical protein
MIAAKIETFLLRIPFKSDTGAAASAWGGPRPLPRRFVLELAPALTLA